MKAKLIFDLPEESHEWRNALEGARMRSVLWDFDQWMRSKIKYEDLNDDKYQAFQACRDHLRTLLHEENIDLEK